MTAAQQDQAPMATPGCREGETYDVVVLGAGPVGQNVADRARAGACVSRWWSANSSGVNALLGLCAQQSLAASGHRDL